MCSASPNWASPVLLAAGAFSPLLSAIGSFMGVVTFAITWSFFFTTPGVVKWSVSRDPMAWNLAGEFLFKDIVLLCVCIVLLLASLPRSVIPLRAAARRMMVNPNLIRAPAPLPPSCGRVPQYGVLLESERPMQPLIDELLLVRNIPGWELNVTTPEISMAGLAGAQFVSPWPKHPTSPRTIVQAWN